MFRKTFQELTVRSADGHVRKFFGVGSRGHGCPRSDRPGCLFFVAVFLLAVQTAPAIVPWSLFINTNNVVNVTNYGAVGDGVFTNTTAIQNAINAATAGVITNGLI